MRRTIALLLATVLPSCGASRSAPSGEATALSHVASLSAFATHVHPLDRLVRVEGGFARVTGAWRPLSAIDAVLPSHAGGPMRLASTAKPSVWIELTVVSDRSVEAHVDGNAIVHAGAARDTDVVLLAEPARVEEIRILRSPDAPRTTRYRLTLGPDAALARVNGDVVEIVDRAGAVVLASEPLFAIDARGVRVPASASIDEGTLSITFEDRGDLIHPIALDPAWVAAGSLPTGRYGHGYAKLSGEVLVIGGRGTGVALPAPVEKWNAPSTWSASESLTVPREFHTTTECGGGVVIAGGVDSTGATLASVEVYAPFGISPLKVGNPLLTARARHSAVCLSMKMIVAGGVAGSTFLSSAEVGTGIDKPTFAAAPSMPAARASMAAVALTTSKALFIGGEGLGSTAGVFANAYIYDGGPGGGWSTTGSMSSPRMNHAAVILSTGQVLVAGGRVSKAATEPTNTVELYDPATGVWTTRKPMANRRQSFALIEVAAGRVLAAGGSTENASTEVYDVATDNWLPAGSMSAMRLEAGGGFLGLLSSRTAIVAGGKSAVSTAVLANAEAFKLLANAQPCTLSGECASGCCTALACAACGDAGPPADTGTPTDTGTVVIDTGTVVTDTGSVLDTTVVDTAVPDTTTNPDTNVVLDTSVEDTTSVAADSSAPVVDSSATCTASDECSADSYCDQGRCVPRIARPELGCGCVVVGNASSGSASSLAALAGVLMLVGRRRREHARRSR